MFLYTRAPKSIGFISTATTAETAAEYWAIRPE